MSQRKGRYSGNIRLDTSTFEEPEQDNDFSRDLYLNELINDPDYQEEIDKKIEQWKKTVGFTCDPNQIQIHTVGESHIDCAWLWRFEQTRQKAIHTFRKAVTHSKMFPDTFCFALSEPLLLDWVLEDDPELFKDIQECVKAGNIELVGGSYVEPDCMMPSGEAFVRERLYGMRFYREHFGILPKVEWFLDSFGYNWGIPQILAKSGAKYFWTSKITWNRETTFPFVNFWWEGPDGSRILTANFQMGPGPLDRWMMYEIGRHPLKPEGRKIWNYEIDYEEIDEHVEEDEICPHIGNFFGKGDGGHGPTHQEVANANLCVKSGFWKWSRVETFYNQLEKWSDRFPVWRDELYLENHRGTFSVHAEVKRHNRLYENQLTSMETLGLISSLTNNSYKYPFEEIERLWKMVLRNQFHDVLPGSSIPEVYDDCWEDWIDADKTLATLKANVGNALVEETHNMSDNSERSKTAEVFLYNSLAWKRTSPVFIPISVFSVQPSLDENGKPPYAKIEILNHSNESIICQPIAAEPEDTIEKMPAGWWVVLDLNAISTTPAIITLLDKSTEIPPSSELSSSENTISNGIISLSVDPNTGAILSLTNEDIFHGNNLLSGNESNLTFAFEDTPKEWPAWNIKREYWKYPINYSNTQNVKISITELGTQFITLEISRQLGKSPVIQKITLFRACSEVYLQYLTDWKDPEVMLKVLYNTATKANRVTADIAYGAIERSTLPETPADKARYEKICHKYFDLSTPENKWGISVLNEGKYAFDATGSYMRLTMLRSPPYPAPAAESWVNKERDTNSKDYDHVPPKYSGLGPFKCRYALLPHSGGALFQANDTPNGIVKQKAEEFNQPIWIIPTQSGSLSNLSVDKPFIHGNALLEIDVANVYLGTVKLNEWNKSGTLILRVVEGSGLETPTTIQFHSELAKKIVEIREVDLLERPIDAKFEWKENLGSISFEIGKFEIKTFELLLK